MNRSVVKKLLKLLTFRNESLAFDLEGTIQIETPNENELLIIRSNKAQTHQASLLLNAKNYSFTIKSNGEKIII